jgi:hypothetical protein
MRLLYVFISTFGVWWIVLTNRFGWCMESWSEVYFFRMAWDGVWELDLVIPPYYFFSSSMQWHSLLPNFCK